MIESQWCSFGDMNLWLASWQFVCFLIGQSQMYFRDRNRTAAVIRKWHQFMTFVANHIMKYIVIDSHLLFVVTSVCDCAFHDVDEIAKRKQTRIQNLVSIERQQIM